MAIGINFDSDTCHTSHTPKSEKRKVKSEKLVFLLFTIHYSLCPLPTPYRHTPHPTPPHPMP
ncbi:MAG: hypothetical protein F6J93_26825 [Oscillatoria sp. SIO1A7]|nr:hypothetical protein [Oscillatoria sp. SIO1A7]